MRLGPVRRVAAAAQSPDGIERWVVTGYAEAVAALSDPRLSTQRAYEAGAGSQVNCADAGTQATDGNRMRQTMLTAGPPDHTRLRKIVVRAFSATRIEALRPRVQQIAGELLDALAARDEDPVDLVETFALPLPVRVICEILGVPRDQCDRLLKSAGLPGPHRGIVVPVDAISATLAELIAARRRQPADDLLSTLTAAHEQGRLSDTELINTAVLLFAAAHHNTAILITRGVLTLLQHPQQLAEVRSGATHVSSAVDELLRHHPPAVAVPRHALEDVEIGGVAIPGGSYVQIVLAAGNRDPAVFTAPDSFDIHRAGGEGLAFGHGIHSCLGTRLAKLEGEVAIGTLLRRFPGLAIAATPDGGSEPPKPVSHGDGWLLPVHLNKAPAIA
ncbi:MAG TPA: cytochrome P450 [Streptosporangiaceae bacterium]|nr:cytochrome P450 [Streptosporangiaceae bacterium]